MEEGQWQECAQKFKKVALSRQGTPWESWQIPNLECHRAEKKEERKKEEGEERKEDRRKEGEN